MQAIPMPGTIFEPGECLHDSVTVYTDVIAYQSFSGEQQDEIDYSVCDDCEMVYDEYEEEWVDPLTR